MQNTLKANLSTAPFLHKPWPSILALPLIITLVGLGTGCQNNPSHQANPDSVTDGPPEVMLDSSTLKDAEPRYEPRSRYGNHSPYTVLGKTYEVIANDHPLTQEGIASWYGTKFHGKRTSSWETYDMLGMTAAHRSLPLPTYVKVTNLKNKRSTVVKVNDRGPFHSDRIIDLSYAAAVKLGFARHGTAPVKIEVIPMSSLQPQQQPVKQSIKQESPLSQRSSFRPHDELTNTITNNSQPLKNGVNKAQSEQPIDVKKNATLNKRDLKAPAEKLFIQVGAYSDAQRAKEIQSKLQDWVNFPVVIDRSPRNRLFRVQIGPLRSSVQAQAINQLLAKEFDILEPMLVWN